MLALAVSRAAMPFSTPIALYFSPEVLSFGIRRAPGPARLPLPPLALGAPRTSLSNLPIEAVDADAARSRCFLTSTPSPEGRALGPRP